MSDYLLPNDQIAVDTYSSHMFTSNLLIFMEPGYTFALLHYYRPIQWQISNTYYISVSYVEYNEGVRIVSAM